MKLKQAHKCRFNHLLVASLKQIGIWLDYLKEKDVYDNTRIIIVADHGYELYLENDGE